MSSVPDPNSLTQLDLANQGTYDAREYLDAGEAATIVGLHERTIKRAIQRGELRAFKPAGQIRVRREDLNEWIESSVVVPTSHDI